ncbi:SGM_3592 family protein [Streptomyces sp. NPDC054796]|uniref:Uncharacterized protein n=1 Tax=Streptomyces daliensis TaxID=299421 RepID=A0A8T4ITD5_9ACTN|nr:hypothetical protein [Streptomyces daliensis]
MGSEANGHGTERGGEGSGDREERWDDLVLDEDFIRSAEVNEPAARTRMLRERWRDRPPEPQPWRADEPPAGWFFSKGRRRARKRRRGKNG